MFKKSQQMSVEVVEEPTGSEESVISAQPVELADTDLHAARSMISSKTLHVAESTTPREVAGKLSSARRLQSAEIRSAFREHSPRALEVLVSLMEHFDARIRLLAAQQILDRGLGKPTVYVENTHKEGVPDFDTSRWSQSDFEAALQLAAKAAIPLVVAGNDSQPRIVEGEFTETRNDLGNDSQTDSQPESVDATPTDA